MKPALVHMILDRLYRIRKIEPIMLPLPGFHQCDQHVEPIALGRVALRSHQALDLLEGAAVITLGLDCVMSMTSTSYGLYIDPIVLPVRADEPDIDDPIGIIDPHTMRYLLPAMLNTARPSLRMLAPRMW